MDKAEAILLTQHFANLNMMSEEEQIRSYKLLRINVLQDVPLIIKKHPDDFLNYRKIFPDAECIKEIFPAELLPMCFGTNLHPSTHSIPPAAKISGTIF